MLRRLFGLVPARNERLYAWCRQYVDRYRGDNDDDMRSNGELRFLQAVVPDARLVFDVGANVGDWARLVLGLNDRVQLHCFEPSAATFRLLTAHAFPGNVICNNVGLGSTAGPARLQVFAAGSGMNSLYARHGLGPAFGIEPAGAAEIVHLESFDAYLERSGLSATIDLCKIDVEGHELEVMKGMIGALRRRQVARIQFEYGGCNLDSRVFLEDIFSFLQPLGYELHKLQPTRLEHHARYDRRLENFQYQNWVALLKGLEDSSHS
jgi:FkbM family methyltransferase